MASLIGRARSHLPSWLVIQAKVLRGRRCFRIASRLRTAADKCLVCWRPAVSAARRNMARPGAYGGLHMAIQFNHTILYARDSRGSAKFLTDILGLPAPTHWGPFEMVRTANGANLDYMDTDGKITPQHYAFLISDPEFDDIFGRIQERKLAYWADPGQQQEEQINRHDGGRGVYFEDPNGHLLEIITRPYGSGGWNP